MKARHEKAIVAVVIIAILGAYFMGFFNSYIPDEYDSDVIIGKIEDFIASRPTGNGGNGDDDDDTTGDDDDDTTGDDDDTTVIADLNCDGVLDSGDTEYLSRHVVGMPGYETMCDSGDIDCSGEVNTADVRYLAKYLDGDPMYDELYPGGC